MRLSPLEQWLEQQQCRLCGGTGMRRLVCAHGQRVVHYLRLCACTGHGLELPIVQKRRRSRFRHAPVLLDVIAGRHGKREAGDEAERQTER